MTAEGFRQLALTLPEAHESAHREHPDFRVGKKVFATLGYPDGSWGVLKLTVAQQAQWVAEHPEVFVPVRGGWGLRGSTQVRLRSATRVILEPALAAAWTNIAPVSLRKRLHA